MSETTQPQRTRKRKRKSRFDDKPPQVKNDGQGSNGSTEATLHPLLQHRTPSSGGVVKAADRAQAIAKKLGLSVSQQRVATGGSGGGGGSNGWPTGDGASHRGADFREKVVVPDFIVTDPEINFIGLMLGPRGQTQKQMELETGAKITIRGRGSSKDGQGPEEDEDLYVLIVADSESKVEAAKNLVNEIIYNKGKRDRLKHEQMKTVAENNGSNTPPDPMFDYERPAPFERAQNHYKPRLVFDSRDDQPTETISIPADKVGIVIGRRGDTIKAIQEETGAFLQVEREHNPAHPNTREVKIQGSPDQIEKAKAEINKYIGGQVSWRGRMIEGNDSVTVPNSVVGLIIGKAGETIKFLQATTGCTIQVTPDSMSNPSEHRRINLSGTPEECEVAKNEIHKLVEQHKGNRYVPGSIGSEQEVMVVPSQCAGVLIGKGGDNVKQLASKTGTRIQVQRQAVGEYREVTIRGDRQNIEYAKQEIQKVIDNHSMNGGGYGWNSYGAAYNMWQPQAYDPTQASTGSGTSNGTGGSAMTTPAAVGGTAAPVDPSAYGSYAQYYQYAVSQGGQDGSRATAPMVPAQMLQPPAMGYVQPQPPPPSIPPEPRAPPPQQPPPPASQPPPPQPSHRMPMY